MPQQHHHDNNSNNHNHSSNNDDDDVDANKFTFQLMMSWVRAGQVLSLQSSLPCASYEVYQSDSSNNMLKHDRP